MLIRDERREDIEVIGEVTRAAFEGHPFSRQTEAFIVRALREAGALTLSLVAEDEGRVVGHIAFSPVAMSDGTPDWYGIGPVSVLPARQRSGIGSALLREGIARIRALGARGCVLVGDPAYYPRFGFRNDPGLAHEGVPPEVFFILPFGGAVPKGTVHFHEGFRAEA